MKKQTNTKKPGAKPAKKQTKARAKLATPPPPVEVEETVAAELPGTSPEEVTRAAQAVAIRDADRHKQNAERYAGLAVVFDPGIKADEATRRAMLEKAGWIAPAEVSREMEAAWGEFAGLAREANESAERGLLAAIQNDPGAWQVFADEAKKEEALRDAALARAEKAGDVLRQLETDKRNAELAAALREHTAALHEGVRPAPSSSKPDAKGGKGGRKGRGKNIPADVKIAVRESLKAARARNEEEDVYTVAFNYLTHSNLYTPIVEQWIKSFRAFKRVAEAARKEDDRKKKKRQARIARGQIK